MDARFYGVDACGVDTAVSQKIRQADDVPLHGIKGSGKQVPQVVGKHLPRGHTRFFAKSFHGAPDTASVEGIAVSGAEDRSLSDPRLFRIGAQCFLQILRKQNTARFIFALDGGLPCRKGFHSDEFQLADADACFADGADHQLQGGTSGGGEQAAVFSGGEFFFFLAEDPALDLL